MSDTTIKHVTTESFVPNVPTRVLSMAGILVSEVPAVPVNAAGATYDHIQTSPSIKAANARIAATATGAGNVATGIGSLFGKAAKSVYAKATSDDAKAARSMAADRAKSALSSAGKKIAEITPVKVVIEGAKELADDAVQTWNETGQPTVITTVTELSAPDLPCGHQFKVCCHDHCVKGEEADCGMCNDLVWMTCDLCKDNPCDLLTKERIQDENDTLSPRAFEDDPMDPNNL